MKNIKNRSSNIDIIRLFALYTVIGVHFFMKTDFYTTPIVGKRMFFGTIIRSFFMVSVPLFLMITGYLMRKKTFTKAYYKGIVHTLITYAVISIFIIVFKHFYFGDPLNLFIIISGIFNYTGASYAWYIEMYIGLFLLIPFLNVMYQGLDSRKKKIALILTLIIVSSLPTITNIFSYSGLAWWKKPSLSTNYVKVIPSWWTWLYPVMYYFIGAYLDEFKIKLEWKKNLILLVAAVFGYGIFNIYRSGGGNFPTGSFNEWQSMFVLVETILLFILINTMELKQFSNKTKKTLFSLSNLALGAYLLSNVFDVVFYDILIARVPALNEQFLFLLPITIVIFVASLISSYLIQKLIGLLKNIFKRKNKTILEN